MPQAVVATVLPWKDAADDGQIKQYLLQQWVVSELRTKQRMVPETKKTLRWAREVCRIPDIMLLRARLTDFVCDLLLDGQDCNTVNACMRYLLLRFFLCSYYCSAFE